MIHQVLIKRKCIIGYHILNTLVEVCCGEDITHISENGEFKLDIESSAIIQDVKLLEELLLHRKIWNKAEQGVWETLLAALEVLIQADHHQQVFNIKPLLKAQVVHHFLLTCQVLQMPPAFYPAGPEEASCHMERGHRAVVAPWS
ncbi:PREDICTED: lysosomal-trafficking regulator-like isoform X3 [Galeopterus variegatus]|uniref:Lysosomal-trafficking regulator-like isoform X3 n=1 Tax=Galeopterus variegatus TaxID=482537 RepID=A0ABM0SDM5_GALVR|nr:PREDICTED: lysosomal-trafficking regulator-like isoform X3 [Galeopterus variegatus]